MDIGVLSAGHKEADNEAIAIRENKKALEHRKFSSSENDHSDAFAIDSPSISRYSRAHSKQTIVLCERRFAYRIYFHTVSRVMY